MNALQTLIVTTGGTGGHIFPALAVAQEARQRNPKCRVIFAGGGGPEGALAARAGLEFVRLPARGVLGTGLRKLSAPFWLAGAVLKSLALMRRIRPDAVLGFGGYAGFAPVLAASLLGIPAALHEQNSVPGAANRSLRRFADEMYLSFEESRKWFPANRCVVTGNPVRADIAAVGRAARTWGRNLLVLGGSQGARALNDAVIEALPTLRDAGVAVLHQAGPADLERVRTGYAAIGFDPDGPQFRAVGFLEDMATAYAEADLIFCRSGASTVFEAAAAGRACVFVPFPHATHDHQTRNAQAMERVGAARLLPQDGLGGGTLSGTVLGLLSDANKLDRMAEAARGFARPDAAAEIVNRLERLAAKHKGRKA
ncbi:MAG: undecaprenyldiphospho-muramoylpentapeptide beta-N-acetylglucosaminyltransferase [Desulfovibrio sp.]